MAEDITIKLERGSYQIENLIGKGGMGEIYKAYDPLLKRYVALKFLWHENPENMERFIREARAQAKVRHNNICRVYEVGESKGRTFIAMQYIDGKSLDKAVLDMSLEQKIKVMMHTAEAAHEAHRQGLIHRDLKPANIMIEPQKDGSLKPYILDFGIAREPQGTQLTTTGMIMGTPQYMAPEQARGDFLNLDRRTDIYALGVVLFFLLAGELPFIGDTPVEILMKVVEQEPPELKKLVPAIPADLNTIVMKCLEKEPDRRYDSAKALAEDLQHYLNDEPIEARDVSRFYRFKKKLAKNKLLSSVVAAAVLTILFLSGWGINNYLQGRKKAILAQQFGQQVKEIETLLRFAHMLPLHNTLEEKEIVRQKIAVIIRDMEQVGSVAKGPGNYAVGRGYLSLREYKKAFEYLNKALEHKYREPEVAYALGLVLGVIYNQEMEEAQAIRDEGLRKDQIRNVVKQYRLPALQNLKMSRNVSLGSPLYIEGLIAFYEERYQKALDFTSRALNKTPWLHEVAKLEGDIYGKLARKSRMEGNSKQSLAYYEKAEKSYQKAITIARSDTLNYYGLAEVRAGLLTLTIRMGNSPDQIMEKLLSCCQKAITADPQNAGAYNVMSFGYSFKGWFLMAAGKDPVPTLNTAIGLAEKSLELDSGYYDAWSNLGMALQIKSDFEGQKGKNPEQTLKKAIEAISTAIKLRPNIDYPYNNLGNTFWTLANHLSSTGKDPLNSYNLAIKAFKKAITLVGQKAVNLHNLSGVLVHKAQYLMSRGKDCHLILKEALENGNSAVEKNPEVPAYYSTLVEAELAMAELNILNGADADVQLDNASKNLDKGLMQGPDQVELLFLAAKTEFIRWLNQMDQSSQASRFLTAARNKIVKHAKKFPDLIEPMLLLARIDLAGSLNLSITGKSAAKNLQNTIKILYRVLNKKPDHARAELDLALAQAMISIDKNQEDPAAKSSISRIISRILEQDPANSEALLIRGLQFFLAGRINSDPLQKLKLLAEARQQITKAFSANKFLKPRFSSYLRTIGLLDK